MARLLWYLAPSSVKDGPPLTKLSESAQCAWYISCIRLCLGFKGMDCVYKEIKLNGRILQRNCSKTCVKLPLKNRQNKDLNDCHGAYFDSVYFIN